MRRGLALRLPAVVPSLRRSSRFLALQPLQQALALEAHDATTAEHRHRGVPDRPPAHGLLADLQELRDLRRGVVGGVAHFEHSCWHVGALAGSCGAGAGWRIAPPTRTML